MKNNSILLHFRFVLPILLLVGLGVVLVVDLCIFFGLNDSGNRTTNQNRQTHTSPLTVVAAAPAAVVGTLLGQRKNAHSDAVNAASSAAADLQDNNTVVFKILLEAGVLLDEATKRKLPTWKLVTEQYGTRPRLLILHGLNQPLQHGSSCDAFQMAVPAVRRMLGAAGMFSTGTNLVTHLLKRNCYIPERAVKYGTTATRVCACVCAILVMSPVLPLVLGSLCVKCEAERAGGNVWEGQRG
jgi:hypothetical protein